MVKLQLTSLFLYSTLLAAVNLAAWNAVGAASPPPVLTKARPSLQPESKKALFVAHFDTNTEVNQMLPVAEKLKERGHDVEFIVNIAFQDKVERAGHKVVKTIPHLLEDPSKKEAYVAVLREVATMKSWYTYMTDFFPALIKLSAATYEPCLIATKDYVGQNRPDVLVSSMFSDCAIDVAKYYDIPTGVIYAAPLGGLFGYEDHAAAPDSVLWEAFDQHASFWPRLRKVIALIILIAGTTDTVEATNSIRTKHGIPAIGHPLTNWDKLAVFHTWSLGVDLARPSRPLTFSTGFVVDEYQEPKTLTPMDQQLKNILDQHPGGVVYAAFGSLTTLTQEMLTEIVQGIDQWIKQQEQPAAAIVVLNKYSQDMDTTSILSTDASSVHILSGWIAQRMILEHAQCRAFITHAGQGSIAEAVYHQVPMLAMPMFGDQPHNGHRVQEAGIGLNLHFREEPVMAATIAAHLAKLTNTTNGNAEWFQANLARQYQISARSGGASKIADVVEDMMLLGHLEHLVPVSERVPFPANTNLDLYAFFMLVVTSISYLSYKSMVAMMSVVVRVSRRASSRKERTA